MRLNKAFVLIGIIALFYISYIQTGDIKKIIILKEPFFISDLQLTNYKEKKIYLKEKKADYFLLNFWASWCAPCIKEMHSFNKLTKNNENIKVLTVSQDSNLLKAENFFKKNNYKYLEKYYDFNKEVLKNFSIRGIPTTFIINSQYQVFAKVEGLIEWDSKQFKEWLYKN